MQDRTVTLPTLDHGEVTLPEPSWCAGHTDHRPDTYRVDLAHRGTEHSLTLPVHQGFAEVLHVALEARPFVEGWPGTEPFVSVGFDNDHHPTSVYGLEVMAVHLERHTEALREFARRLAVVRAGGEFSE